MTKFDLDAFLNKSTPNIDFTSERFAEMSAEMKMQIALIRQNAVMIEQQGDILKALKGHNPNYRPHDPIGGYRQPARHAA